MFQWKPKSLNYQDRPAGVEPSILLMHYTGMESFEAAKDRLSEFNGEVSAHYIIDEAGNVHDLVPEDRRAWHAGVSYWRKETDINSHSIGVEIVNPGHEYGYRDFPDVQMGAVLNLSQAIMERHNIIHVLAHSDVSPERKQDPGERFNWRWLAGNGVGLWPDPTEAEYITAESVARNDFEAEKLFITLGYNPMAAYVDVVTAFHRHYYPERFEVGEEGQICVETIARIMALIRQLDAAQA